MKFYRPKDLTSYLSKTKTFPNKKLSQNFLIDKNIIDKILNIADTSQEDIILEIGPGLGAISLEILKKCKKLIVVEKDKNLSFHLSQIKNKKLEVINSDFLKLDLNFLKKFKKLKMISSIPYHISTSIIKKLIQNHSLFSSITLIVQKEMAQRLTSKINTKNYNAFSIFANFYAHIEIKADISRNCFFPRPNVDSSIIQLTIRNNLQNIPLESFYSLLKQAFLQRRKKLLTNLKAFTNPTNLKDIFQKLNISLDARAENLKINEFYALFKELNQKK